MRSTDRDGTATPDGRIALIALSVAIPGIGLLAYATGGQASPWIGLLYVPLVLAGLMSVQTALLAALWASGVYMAVAAMRPTGIETPLSISLHVPAYVAVAVGIALVTRRRHAARKGRAAASSSRPIQDVGRMITAAYDLTMTLDLVILKQREVLRADAYAVLLVEGASLRVHTSSGMGPEAKTARFSPHDDDHGWRPVDGRPLAIADTALTQTRYSVIEPAMRSILLVPLFGVERLVGVLYFGGREPDTFSTEDEDRAEAFGDSVVFPLQRALLEEDLKRLAYTDAQTTLYNHRHFQAQMEEEVGRAQRYGRVVSLILLDVDGFKEFNDRFGHPAGDRLLADLAHMVRSNLRTVDVAARYGGEEFAVICPETQREQAVVLADRLCARIAEAEFLAEDGTAHHITVSMGVASYPADAQNKAELIDAADRAMYESKRAGKNRVSAFRV